MKGFILQMNNKTVKLAVFASGTGSNFHAILKDKSLRKHIALLISDRPGARAIEIAKRYEIPTFVFNPKDFKNKIAYEEQIKQEIDSREIDLMILAGYMRLIGDTLLSVYEGKIINIHPSYLPNFPGKDAIGQALRAEVDTTGVTIHYVDSGMDTGPIISQEEVLITKEDTLESLTRKIQAVEHRLYPKVIKQLMEDLT